MCAGDAGQRLFCTGREGGREGENTAWEFMSSPSGRQNEILRNERNRAGCSEGRGRFQGGHRCFILKREAGTLGGKHSNSNQKQRPGAGGLWPFILPDYPRCTEEGGGGGGHRCVGGKLRDGGVPHASRTPAMRSAQLTCTVRSSHSWSSTTTADKNGRGNPFRALFNRDSSRAGSELNLEPVSLVPTDKDLTLGQEKVGPEWEQVFAGL